jgi:hypothetical protein
LRLNVKLPQGNCQLLGQVFQSSLTLSCTFLMVTTAILEVVVYHASYPAITLASTSHSMPILAAPSGGCSNQMCDSCSQYNGQ